MVPRSGIEPGLEVPESDSGQGLSGKKMRESLIIKGFSALCRGQSGAQYRYEPARLSKV